MKPRAVVSAVAAVMLATVVLAACGADTPDDAAPDPTTSSTAPHEAEGPGTVEIPETPVGSQTRWVLEQLSAEDGPSADGATERFAEEFLAELPADQVAAMFVQLRAYGPFEITGYQGTGSTAQTTVTNSAGEPMALEVAVDDAAMINGLFLRQMTEPPEIGAWSDVDTAYSDTPGARVFAADVADGSCSPVHTFGNASQPAPLGSTFKLYVLGAVQQAVLDGRITWDDTVTLTADVRVPTSVDTEKHDDGTELTVAEAARSMIAVSDNTATDLLVDLVGRDSVEQAVVDMGHSDPASMRPMLKTRELFQLAWTDPALRDAWAAGDEQERRSILASLPDGAVEVATTDIVDPVHQYGVGWFASGEDVCAAHVAVQELAAADESDVVRDLLAVNPGITVDTQVWPYVAYKGGSAPGVLTGSWYLEDADGRAQVLVVQFAGEDPAALADLAYLFGVARSAFGLLAD